VWSLILANTLVPPRRLLWLSRVFLALLCLSFRSDGSER
jgi:hypothetical protein